MRKLTTKQISIITIVTSIVMITVGIITSDAGIIGNAIILSTFLIATPLLYVRYKRFRESKEMEEKFPNFLRDLIESLRAGIPLHKAIISANRINYGTLSKEIGRMSNQLSWGMPIDKVLTQFIQRAKSSKRISSGMQIVLQSYFSGGEIVSTMDSVADSQLTLLDTDRERSSTLNQYVVIMYAISLIFIGIVIAVNKLMVPLFGLSQQGAEFGLSNPCDACSNLECSVCSVYNTVSNNVFGLDTANIGAYYTSLFFFMSFVQAIFSGLVAGQISEGSLVAGTRHSLILASITFGVFSIIVRLGIIGV
ncbi:MAG: type II secretion system F family protein [Candidatus Aenigmarchaeota archaeon]|nr:type II secretion system F family protein [Candidatus Aenigmarchaeota archaeon]